MGLWKWLFGDKQVRLAEEQLTKTAKESGEKLKQYINEKAEKPRRRRIIPAPIGMPALEPLRHEVYDIQVLPPEGSKQLA